MVLKTPQTERVNLHELYIKLIRTAVETVLFFNCVSNSYYFSLHQQSKYKVINKDQWCNVLEFSRTINLDLSNYDEDGACKYRAGYSLIFPIAVHLPVLLTVKSLRAVLFSLSLFRASFVGRVCGVV